MIRPGGSAPLTLLDCQIGGHTGHFTITRVRVSGERSWGCDACIAAKLAETPWLRSAAR
jgi:hypothetical protein